MQKQIEIFTDGSCLGNPGRGGIGILLRYKQHEKQIYKGYFLTTNNRMELLAVIEALKTALQNGFLIGKKITGKRVRANR